jgi:hypothetical protein
VAAGIFGMGRARLNDERLRTAAALKANDEVVARLRTASSEVLSRQVTIEELESKKKELEKQVAELEAKNTALGLELEALRPKKGRR